MELGDFLDRAARVLARAEAWLPPVPEPVDWATTPAARSALSTSPLEIACSITSRNQTNPKVIAIIVLTDSPSNPLADSSSFALSNA